MIPPAETAPPAEQSARWPAPVALAILLAVVVLGVRRLPAAPDPMPTHWNGLMEPDAWGPKTLGGFLAPVFIGFLPVVLFWVMPRLARMQESARPASDITNDGPTLLTLREPPGTVALNALTRLCHRLALVTATLIALIALLSWFGVTGPIAAVLVWATVATLLVVIAVGIVQLRRTQ